MSLRDARKFVKELHTDTTLRKKVSLERDHILKVAKDKGYKVTPKDMRAAITEHWAGKDADDEAAVILSEAPGF